MSTSGPNTFDAVVSAAKLTTSPTRQDLEACPCWNRIGVWGKGTCPDLPRFIHCRNCPVCSGAAVQLLDRPLLPDYRREWTERFAHPRQSVAPPKTSVLLFRISAQWLALSTEAFQEVAEHRLVHSLPHRRQGIVLGLVNVRGELLICVSVGRLLAVEQSSSPEPSRRRYDRLLVTNWEGRRLVFPADDVHGICRFQRAELQEPPATLTLSIRSYLEGLFFWETTAVGLLNADRLFAALNRSLT